jgi:hypothetical protein
MDLQEVKYPRLVGRAITHDHAFSFRMGAGFPGEVTRSHPSGTIEANRISPTAPVLGFGLACIFDPATASVRQAAAGDTALLDIYGIAVRFYPGQANVPPSGQYGAQPFNVVVPPPLNQPLDVLRQGYILVQAFGTPRKGDPVFLWIAASGGGHVQGGFEIAASTTNTIPVGGSKTTWASGPDANGIAELAFNI